MRRRKRKGRNGKVEAKRRTITKIEKGKTIRKSKTRTNKLKNHKGKKPKNKIFLTQKMKIRRESK